ncbi:MAG TPA: helix-turn-helix transcriptional regulator [bacterium]|nr:helix-turn-helix transcriptional regulator [bacterium]HOM27068.1 helix-turn-helix transcriptional regulator [bacterium]
MEDFYKKIGRKIREVRKSKKITQEELAYRIGVTPNFIGLIERGKKRPSIETLRKISDALEVPVSYFFDKITYKLPEEDIITKKISAILKDTTEEEKKGIYKFLKSIVRKKK